MSGLDIDTLWDINARFKEQTPQFHGYYIPGADEEPEKVPGAFPSRPSRPVHPGVRADDDSDDDMPDLQSVSHSSTDDDRDSDSEWGSEDDHWDEDDWDTEDEEGVNEYIREMMDVGLEHPDFLDPRTPIPEFDKYADERKDNPFLKLLGSLRGNQHSTVLLIPIYLYPCGRSSIFLERSPKNHGQNGTEEANDWLGTPCIDESMCRDSD